MEESATVLIELADMVWTDMLSASDRWAVGVCRDEADEEDSRSAVERSRGMEGDKRADILSSMKDPLALLAAPSSFLDALLMSRGETRAA